MPFLSVPRIPVTPKHLENERRQAQEEHRHSIARAWIREAPRDKPCPCGLPSEKLATPACRELIGLWVPTPEDVVGERLFDTKAYSADLSAMCKAVDGASETELQQIRAAAVEIFRLKFGTSEGVTAPSDREALANFLCGASELLTGRMRRWTVPSIEAGRRR